MKELYDREKFLEYETNLKQVWHTIKGVTDTVRTKKTNITTIDNPFVNTAGEIEEEFNGYFATVS